jgi:uncharacterized repeat protein (TIGR01451 family)
MIAIAAATVLAAPAAATTYTVSDAGDSGAGTLRQAILDANGHTGADDIDFNLLGATISQTSALPAITDPVTIDATSDGGAFLDGASAGVAANGLTLNTSNSSISSLEIDGFDGFGIVIAGSTNTIVNDQIGVGAANAGGGISITSGTGNAIGGLTGPNQIYGNSGPGIAIASSGNIVSGGNTIGDFGAPNGGAGGVVISGTASNNQIGGVNNGDGNQIQGNSGAGVALTGTGTGNAIIGNQISSNDGLGIDLGTTGVTANDAGDGDSGANNLQNFPALTDFATTAGNSTITGTLNSTASTSFRVDFYAMSQCDESGNGEGDSYVGSVNVATNGSGNATINAIFPEIAEHFVTATVTGPGTTGTDSTSEFSNCATGPPTGAVVSNGTVQLGVNNTGDLNYSCTLAEAGCPGDSAGGTGPVGLRYVPLNLDSTAPGCPCEGWGMADSGSGLTGYANQSAGTANVTVNSFSHTTTTAVSDVTISDPGHAGFTMNVVQDYHPSPVSPNLYEDTVTVTNTGNAFTNLRYRRAMDWDVEPTAFNEWSTIQGTSPQLLFDSDDGFASSDPLAGESYIDSESVCGTGYTGACAFTDLGSGGTFPTVTTPNDHGALFDFGFGALAHNASKTFKVYYGAAPTETAALSALSTGGAQVYSLGESDCPNGGSTAGCDALPANAGVSQGKPATFMFGFVTTTGDLSITKTDSPDPVSVNHDLTYTLTVTNNGPEAAAGVHIEDALPAGVTWKSTTPVAGGSCTGTTTAKCDFPSIGNGSSKTVTIVVTPTATNADLANTATVASASADANPANNSATSHTQVVADVPQISIDDVSKTEGDSGTSNAAFTISLDRTAPSDVTVHYATTDVSATQPADYTSTSGTATITTGNTSTTVNVPVVGDTIDETDETFHVDLSSPSGGAIADNQGVGTIIDDDGPTISIGDASVTEGNSGTTPATFTVSLSAASPQTITVHYATSDDTATQPSDYAATSGTLTFNPGDTSKTVTVNVNGDTTVEPSEAFHLDLTTPSNATIADALGIGTITNDDVVTPPATPTLAIGDATVNPEGNSGTKNADFTVSLSSAAISTITVQYTSSDDTANAPGDYTATAGTLTFSPGDTSKAISVPVVGDTVPEPNETFSVDLSAPSGATISDGHGIGTIVDDDRIGGGGSVGSGDLFCGTQHRGKCQGLKVKDEFDRPGNASWTFAAYNPPPGKARAHAAAAKPIKLGTVKRKVAKGKVSFVFKLKPGAKTKKLYKRVVKARLKAILITRTFTPAGGGSAETVTKTVKLKR